MEFTLVISYAGDLGSDFFISLVDFSHVTTDDSEI